MIWQRSGLACLLLVLLLAGCSSRSAKRAPDGAPAPPVDAAPSPDKGPGAGVPTGGPSLTELKMVDAATGWALGSGKLYRTTDGGKTWASVLPSGVSIADGKAPGADSVSFLDGKSGWLAGKDSAGFAIFRTTDGGATWQKAAMGSPLGGVQLSFLDARHGWLLEHNGVAMGSEAVTVRATADGGATWTLVAQTDTRGDGTGAIPFGGGKSGLTFSNTSTGWLAGYQPVAGSAYLIVTRDGGKTWHDQNLPAPQAYADAQFTSFPPQFFDSSHGILPATGHRVTLFYATADGGKTWTAMTPVVGGAEEQAAWALADASHGWVAQGNLLQVSTDGGKTWSERKTNVPLYGVRQLAFVGPTTGWALLGQGEQTHLLRTSDGGATWSAP